MVVNTIVGSAPVRSSQLEGPASPCLLRPSRDLSFPIPQYNMSAAGPATITIAPLAYVLFPIDDSFDGVDPLSTSPVSPIPALPGFALIGPPGSLATPWICYITISLHWDRRFRC